MTIPQTFGGFGLSPEEQSPEPNHLQYDDDLISNHDAEDVKPAGISRKGTNPRKGPAAADKRATHNAIERARRENLNGRFMTLAEALPSMGKVKRPSKSVIVNKALEFVYEAQVKEHALVKENNELRREVDQLRRQLGLPPLPPPAPLTGSDSAAAGNSSSSRRRSEASNTSSNATQSPPHAPSQQSPSSSTFPSPPSTVSVAEQSPALPVNVSGMFHNMSFPAADGSPIDAEEFRQQQLAALFPGQSFMAAAPSPAQIHAQAQAQAQVQAQAQAMMQAQLGYMNPAFLSAAQHHHQSMLLAAHQAAVQQQQQQQQQFAHVPASVNGQPQQLSPSQQQPSPSPSSLGGIPGQSPTALTPIDMYNALGSSPLGVASMSSAAPSNATNPALNSWGSFTSTTSEGFSVFA